MSRKLKGGREPSIFQRLLTSYMLMGLIIIIIFLLLSYYRQRQEILNQIKEQFSNTLNYFTNHFNGAYIDRVTDELELLEKSDSFNRYLSSPKEENILTYAEAERRVLNCVTENEKLFLSARFIDLHGREQIVIEANKRLRRYASRDKHPDSEFYARIYALFDRLIHLRTGGIVFDGPFKEQGKYTFLAGIAKSDPEVSGIAGALIFHCDLSRFLIELGEYRIYGEPAASAMTLDGQVMLGQPPEKKLSGQYTVRQGWTHPLFSISEPVRAGKDKKELFRITLNASPRILHTLLKPVLQEVSIIFLVMLSINTLIAYFISRHLSAPLILLSSYVDKFASGDFSVRAEVNSTREIATLVQSFNKMAEKLHGTTVSIDILTKEVNERKRTEEELRNTYEKLKEAQSQLLQASKMAAIGQLASGVAHEINNPLTGVLNNVQLVRLKAESGKEFRWEDFKELLNAIEESAWRCQKITQGLLDFTHVAKGSYAPLSINKIVEKVIDLIEREMKLENIAIQKQFQNDLPHILGEAQLLQQAILDIISNARWAIQQRAGTAGGMIDIKTEYDPEHKQVLLSISDTGIGIPKDNLSRIFEPFFTTKSVGEGTGLGLSLVYNIIREHKGTIEVQSKFGSGAVFRIFFPVA